MRACGIFDRYRDGEAGAAERIEFERHLELCESCRTRIALLRNLVCALRSEELHPPDRANLIAREAFRRAHSWDYEVVSWLRPGPAVAILVLAFVLTASMWMVKGNQQVSAYSEYESLMTESDAVSFGSDAESDLVIWLAQEVTSSD
jgi:anti-sigma factor RsiW